MIWRFVVSLAVAGALCGVSGHAKAVVWHDREIPQPDPIQLPITQADAPRLSDVTFVGDPNDWESQCWYWDMAPGGSLAVDVPITRAVGSIPQLITRGLIDSLAIIQVAAFDIDYLEPHYLSVNGYSLKEPLKGVTCDWFVHRDTIPVRWLEFPEVGQSGVPPLPKLNRIGVKISPYGTPPYDCLSIDWVAITIRVARPILFVHGMNDNGGTWNPAFDPGLRDYAGVPTSRDLTMMPPALDLIANNASKIDTAVERLKTATGSEKVNLVAHSKGGIDARYYTGSSDNIEKVIQIGSPNCGVTWASLLLHAVRSVDNLSPLTLERVANALLGPGGEEMTLDGMRRFNHTAGAYNIDVNYTAIGCLYWPPRPLAIINMILNPEWMGDGFIPLWSTHCIGNFNNSTRSAAPGTPENEEYFHGNQPKSRRLMESAVTPVLREFGGASVPSGAEPPQTAIAFQGDIGEGGMATGTLDLDAMVPSAIALYYPSGEMDLAIRSPSGVLYTRESVEGNPDIGWEDIELPGGRVEAVSFIPPELGRWTVEVEAVDVVEPGDVAAFIATAHMTAPSLVLETELPRTDLVAGDTLIVVGHLTRDAAAASADSVRGVVIGRNGVPVRVVMLDDGVAPDILMNDGRFTGRYPIPAGGTGVYSVICNAKGSFQGVAFSRASGGSATATASRSTFAGVTGSVARDTDGNGHYDKLDVTLSMSCTAAATCIVSALLRDSQGGSHAGTASVSIAPGVQPVVVSFSGHAIGRARVDGPYQIVEVRMAEIGDDGFLPSGVWSTGYWTQPYLFREFEHAPIKVLGPASSMGYDSSPSNPGYEYLDVLMPVDVDITDSYAWWGRLADSQGIPIGPLAEGRGTLTSGGGSLVLRFSGQCIRRNGIDGPFFVKDLIVAGPRHTEFVADSFLTSAHAANDFSSFADLAATLIVEDDSLTVCPAGDLDTLRMTLFIPHECGGGVVGDAPVVIARNKSTNNATVWECVSPTDPGGDVLYAYAYHPGAEVDTAYFQASAISGCDPFSSERGYLSFDAYVEGAKVATSPTIRLMSVDLSRRAFGAVDRIDSTRYVQIANAGFVSTRCNNFNWNTSSDTGNFELFLQHLSPRHHIPRHLKEPNGGSTYSVGAAIPIEWERAPLVTQHSASGQQADARVTLRLLNGQSGQSTALVTNDPDDGSYVWTVPATVPPGTQYRVEVAHTAGAYELDWRDIGTDRSDTTFTIRPKPVTSLSVTTGRNSAALSWVEPGQAGGEADSYDIRYLMNGTLTESNWDGPGVMQLSGEPSPGAADTQHCVEIDPLLGCKSYSFGIRTLDNGAGSVLSVVNGSTPCSGSSIAFCDGGGLMAGGGGEEGARALGLASALGDVQAVGASNENSLLWRDGSGLEVTDLQRLGTGAKRGPSYPVTVRELEQFRAQLDQIRLGTVDHAPNTLAVAGAGQVVVGTPGSSLSLQGSGGSILISSKAPYVARSGEVLVVELGRSPTDRALVLETRRPLAGAKTDSLGIRVERQLPDMSWALAAMVHPRREFDKFAIPAEGSPAMRITFLGSYPIRAVGALEEIKVVTPTPLALSDAAHSRLGTVSPAVRDSGDTRTSLVPGDSLALQFTATEVPTGMVRTLFLTAKGSYERMEGEEDPDAQTDRAVANEPILEFSLGAAYPNPSDGTVTIAYSLARQVPTLLRIYNVAGREVRTLIDEEQTAGRREALWDGRDNGGRKISSGVYFYRLYAGQWRSERKLIVLQR